jgi:autoinducer 2 (AI-2) kinase
MFAGVALGWYSDIAEAADSIVKWERVVEPDEENNKVYDGYYERWCSVYPYLMAVADDGVLPSMWRAPGV